MADEHLHHHLERRPVLLERVGDGDERLDERRAERVDAPEGGVVRRADLAEQARRRPRQAARLASSKPRCSLPRAASSFGSRTFFSMMIGRFRSSSRMVVEPSLLPLERVAEVLRVRAGHPLADEVGEVALPGDEGDERDWPVGVLRVDQLRDLLPLAVQPADVGQRCAASQRISSSRKRTSPS